MENNSTYLWLVGVGDDVEALSLYDVSVYLTEAEARLAADDLEEYYGPGVVFVQRRRVNQVQLPQTPAELPPPAFR